MHVNDLHREKHVLISPDFIFQLQQFKEDNLHVGFGSGTLALEQAIEKTMANIKWMAENKEHVLKWLTDEIAWEMFISVNTD